MKYILLVLFSITTLFAHETLIIGVAGGTGAGKTTLANEIANTFGGKVTLLSQDAYYYDLSHLSLNERRSQNFDHPDSIDFELLATQLTKLKNKESIECPSYSFSTQKRGQTKLIEPKDVIIVEGILILSDPNIRELLDISIFVEADDDVRLLRRIERDIAERGYDIQRSKDAYLNYVRPMHDLYVAPSKYYADLIIPTMGNREKPIQILSAMIEGFLFKKT